MFRFAKMLSVAFGTILAASTVSQAQVIYGNENSHLTRATQSMMAGEFETASRHFSRAVRANLSDEKLVSALNNYCAVEYALGNFEKADEICTKAVAKDRRYWRAYVNRGNARAALGQIDDAKHDLERAVALKPKSRIAKNTLLSFRNGKGTLLAQAH